MAEKSKKELIEENKKLRQRIENLEQRERIFRHEVIKGRIKIRKQIAIVYVNRHEEPYYVEIRAVTFREDVTERDLMMCVEEIRRSLKLELQDFKKSYTGLEKEAVSFGEDKTVRNDIVIQVRIGNKQMVFRR